MAYRTFLTPRNIYHGPGALEALASLPGERVLIVTDRGVRNAGLVEPVKKILRDNKAESTVFDGIEPDPSKSTVWSIFYLAQDFQPDLFIGFGGGSSIDAAKAGWALYEHPELATKSLAEAGLELRQRTLRNRARFVAIPTTSGTGSEVTRFAVITDRDVTPPYKGAWFSPHMMPDVAIADPELTVSMPPAITADTGFDALVHAIECYVLIAPSDMVDSLALGAARTIWEWLPRAVANGRDIISRDKMHLASLKAGIAFNNGTLGLVHETAHRIGAVFGIPHGRANALMLCPVFAFLYPSHKARLVSLASSLGMAGQKDETRVANLLKALDKLKQDVGIPTSIKETGLEESRFLAELDSIANDYINRVNVYVSGLKPEARRAAGIPATASEVKELFLHAWKGTRAKLG